MSRIQIVFASTHGQTAAIADALADHLIRRGHVVELADALAGTPPPPEDYDAVVIGSRVHLDRHAPAIADYVRDHRDALAEIPSFFFSVANSASSIGRFLRETGWEPDRCVTFGGARPSRSSPWSVMDWNAVARFAELVDADVAAAGEPAA
jgi:menaquinone-dependent protoporphyrinogen oxidase